MFAIVLSVVLSQATFQKPDSLSSDDPKERAAAVAELAKQPAHEMRGAWLYDALNDADPGVVLTSIKAWRTYETAFLEELGDAITEGNLDGKPVSEPAKSIAEWEAKLANRLLEIAQGSSAEQSLEATKTLARLTGFDKGLHDALLLKILRLGDPANLKSPFVVGVRTIAKEKPGIILELLKTAEPNEVLGAILSVGFQMPPQADEIYRSYLEKSHPTWLKTLITGFSYREKPVRRKNIDPFLRNGDAGIRLTAANVIDLDDDEWKAIALSRAYPAVTRAMAVEYRISQQWSDDEMRLLHFDPQPLVQASIATKSFRSLYPDQPDYELLWKRYRSSVPELRAACLKVIVGASGEIRDEAMKLAFQDRSALVRTVAGTAQVRGYEAQKLDVYAEGLMPVQSLQIDMALPENRELLAECLRSRAERKTVLGAMSILVDEPRLAIPVLKRLANSLDEQVRFDALASLGFAVDIGGYEALTSVATTANPKVFAAAVGWFTRDVKDRAIPFLRQFITHPNRKVRIAAKSKIAELLKDPESGSSLLGT